MFLVSPEPFNKDHNQVFQNGNLTPYFNNTEYLNQLSCMNNEYQVIEFEVQRKNSQQDTQANLNGGELKTEYLREVHRQSAKQQIQ